MSASPVIVDTAQAVGTLIINQPATLNALSTPVLTALEEGLSKLESDPAIRVIIVTGAGDRAFVAGGDIRDLDSRRGLAHYIEYGEHIHRVFRRFETCDKPTIAAVNGYALGGGTELLLCTDIRLVAAGAKLGLPEINLGLFPGAGGSQRLLRQISPCIARHMMFTGDQITAEEAVALGLVNKVIPRDRLMVEALVLAERIAAKSPLVLKLLKRTLRDGLEMPLPLALSHEQAMIGLVLDTDDAHEGCGAFLAKRPASFRGA